MNLRELFRTCHQGTHRVYTPAGGAPNFVDVEIIIIPSAQYGRAMSELGELEKQVAALRALVKPSDA